MGDVVVVESTWNCCARGMEWQGLNVGSHVIMGNSRSRHQLRLTELLEAQIKSGTLDHNNNNTRRSRYANRRM